ncbi:MAG: hypothetical protein QOI53_1587 [Verrucomicrobiota bacterium]|jgi:hypothetical protein|nr:hypothetical protein [Verrucomicrobiota bacterium]
MPSTPSLNIGEQIDETFRKFEATSDWRLSLPAKVIIQQGFLSMGRDTLGMGDYGQSSKRGELFQVGLANLTAFLLELEAEASKRPEAEKRSKEIGGVFVLQNAKRWQKIFQCKCWPVN